MARWWCDLGSGGPQPPPPQVRLKEYYGTSRFISIARLHCVQWGVQRGPGRLGAQPWGSEGQRYRSTLMAAMPRWINTYWIRIHWPDRTIPVRRSEQPFGRGRHIFEYFPLVSGSPPRYYRIRSYFHWVRFLHRCLIKDWIQRIRSGLQTRILVLEMVVITFL